MGYHPFKGNSPGEKLQLLHAAQQVLSAAVLLLNAQREDAQPDV